MISIKCHAKLNLFLKVYGKRPDGFHDLISVMQSIDLADFLHIEETDAEGIEIICNNPEIPTDDRNLIWRAAEALAGETGRSVDGLKFTVEKNIPVMGGLAGGSSNAAGTIHGLMELWGIDIEGERLRELLAKIGSDVPFCYLGGTVLVRGRGEILEMLPVGITEIEYPGAFLLILPSVNVETKSAYTAIDESRKMETCKWDSLNNESVDILEGWMQAISNGNIPLLFHNDFEEPVFGSMPGLAAIHTNLRNHAGHALLSGSGSCMFAWFPDIDSAMSAKETYIPVAGERVIITHPVNKGIIVESHI